MTGALRIAVAVVWAVEIVLLTTWSNTDGAMAAAVLSTLLAAALIGTWWLLVVPLVPAAVLIAGTIASNEPDADGVTGLEWAAYIAVVTTAIVLLLAVGVGANRLISRAWKHRRPPSGDNHSLPRTRTRAAGKAD